MVNTPLIFRKEALMLKYSVVGNPMGVSVALLHGIFGSANNWKGFILKLLERRPDLRIVLIDLRNHGGSPHFSEENSLLQTAIDVLDLQKTVGYFRAIIGHSFGGKVALQCGDIPFQPEIEEVWALDSSPGTVVADPESEQEVAWVLNTLRSIKMPVQRRSQVKQALLEKGASMMISQWMTTNLRHTDQGYVWKFNLDGIQAMLEDYFEQDLWSVLEEPDLPMNVKIIRASKSDRWDQVSIQRLEALPERSKYYVLDAGHWLHVDNPEGLLSILEEDLLRS
jgi:esterase